MTERAVRILLARPDHLGDLLLSLPAAAWLREAVPNARITALVPPSLAPIAQRCPSIDETLTVPFPPPTAGDAPDGWPSILQEHAAALRDRFDVALLPRIDDPWSGALVSAARIPYRIGFDHPRTRAHLTTMLPVPLRQQVTRLALQVAGAAVRELECVQSPPDLVPGQPWIVPTATDHHEASAVLAACGISNERPVIVLHPGAGWPLKSWPVERWGRLACRVQQLWGVRPVVTGSPTEHELVASIVARSEGAAINVAGLLSLGGLAALYTRSSAVVGIDSGPLHLATAVGTPVAGIYGPAGADEFGPWAIPERARVVEARLACSPCRILAAPPCGAVTQPACLRAISVEAVIAALVELPGMSQRA